MNKEDIESLFKKHKVRIPKEKQGQSECYKCKENHKYSLTWTSFLYEYEEHYYCYEHILNILLQKQNTELKDNWNKLKEWLEDTIEQYGGFAKYRFESVYNKMQEIEGGMNE